MKPIIKKTFCHLKITSNVRIKILGPKSKLMVYNIQISYKRIGPWAAFRCEIEFDQLGRQK